MLEGLQDPRDHRISSPGRQAKWIWDRSAPVARWRKVAQHPASALRPPPAFALPIHGHLLYKYPVADDLLSKSPIPSAGTEEN